MIWKLPFDIPLVVPTLGLPVFLYDALGVIVFVVHISFIYVLLGSSLASVIYNIIGTITTSKEHDDFAYRLTHFTTISENAGALWGVAPLLVIAVLYTGFFYVAILKISPQILHIIYGNILAFLLSYAYKFTWHQLKDHKGLHIMLGVATTLVFFSLPFVFMSMANLYLQPERFADVKNIWDIMLTPMTGFRLLNFFLTAFSVFGIVMIFFAARWQNTEDSAIAKIALSQGKKWFLLAAPLNIAVMPLVLFVFSPRIGEGLLSSPFIFLPFLAALLLAWMVLLVLRQFNETSIEKKYGNLLLGGMVVVILLMATARHGIRVVSYAEPMALQAAATKDYMSNMLVAYEEQKAAEKNRPAADTDARHALAQKKGCLACHSVEMRIVGPAYKDVARKYKSAADIVPSILKGSEGKWAEVNGAKMPPNNVTEEEARTLAEWVMEQR